MNVWLWILQRAPIRDAALDLDERADPGPVADRAAVEVRERADDDVLAELRRRRSSRYGASFAGSVSHGEVRPDASTTAVELRLGDAREDRQREALARELPPRPGTRPAA